MIPNFLYELTHCPSCNESLAYDIQFHNCFQPFDILLYSNIRELHIYLCPLKTESIPIVEFHLKHNFCIVDNKTSDIFKNTTSINQVLNICKKLITFI